MSKQYKLIITTPKDFKDMARLAMRKYMKKAAFWIIPTSFLTAIALVGSVGTALVLRRPAIMQPVSEGQLLTVLSIMFVSVVGASAIVGIILKKAHRYYLSRPEVAARKVKETACQQADEAIATMKLLCEMTVELLQDTANGAGCSVQEHERAAATVLKAQQEHEFQWAQYKHWAMGSNGDP